MIEERMNKIERLENIITKLRAKAKPKQVKKGMAFLKKFKKLGKQADKKIDTVLIQYLTLKQEVVFKVCKVVSGNLIVVNNKVHVLDPKKTWKYGKLIWYIVREIDRIPVSNDDNEEVIAKGNSTKDDVPLIKAVLGAVNKPNMSIEKKNIWIMVILGIVGVVILFTFLK